MSVVRTWDASRATSRALELDYTLARHEAGIRALANDVLGGTYIISHEGRTVVPILRAHACEVHVPAEGSVWARRMVIEEQLRDAVLAAIA